MAAFMKKDLREKTEKIAGANVMTKESAGDGI
jgi:hypothetical protein